MKATDALRQHHREIEELFRRLRTGYGDDDPTALRIELADTIAAHTATEEDLFYPAALDLLGPRCRAFEATEEHAAADFMLARAMAVPTKDDRLSPRLETLYDIFMNHIEEEESELFEQFDSETDGQKSDELGERICRHFERLMPKGHVTILFERVRLPTIGARKKPKTRREQFKTLCIGTLPRVFVNLLAQDNEGIVVFMQAMSDCAEMATWFDVTKANPIPVSSRDPDVRLLIELQIRRDLSKFFSAVLNLSKVSRGMFVKDFDRLLNELGRQDFFGTEGQCDPRGDRRDADPYR